MKKAFTLAEVLITLGIIGVVAAMTLPQVIINYQKHEAAIKLKKAYSTLSQAFQMAESIHGFSKFWEDSYTLGAKVYYERYWEPYFKNPTQCTTYKECAYPQIMAFKYLNGSAFPLGTNSELDNKVMFYLSDGTLYMILTSFGDNRDPVNHIYIDINGGKLPNVMGKDLFKFRRIAGKGIVPDGYNSSISEIENNCSSSGVGTYCAARIINDGWEIKDDYPW